MIDRASRNEVISAFEDYLEDRIRAFEFADRLQEIESEDRTVNEVIHAAWYHYDDCTDHQVQLSKPEWDYFQRLLLVLRSHAELSTTLSRRWSWDHLVAWVSVVAFAGIASEVGWGWHWIAWAVPFGIVSISISHYRRRIEPEPEASEIACTPFESLSQIRWWRRQLPDFRKQKYRARVGSRRIRSETTEAFAVALSYCYQIIFSPLVLLGQGFPSTIDHGLKLTTPQRGVSLNR